MTKILCDLVKTNDLKTLIAFQLALFFVAFVLTILSDLIENFYPRGGKI